MSIQPSLIGGNIYSNNHSIIGHSGLHSPHILSKSKLPPLEVSPKKPSQQDPIYQPNQVRDFSSLENTYGKEALSSSILPDLKHFDTTTNTLLKLKTQQHKHKYAIQEAITREEVPPQANFFTTLGG
jgi:hypothetical protein